MANRTESAAKNNANPKGSPGVSLDLVLTACLAKGLITPKQARYVQERRTIQQARIAAQSSGVAARDPVALLVSHELCSPGREGQPLIAEEIVEAVSSHIRVPTIHIDPLKLDMEAIVKALPRAFAHNHAVLVLDPKADPVPVAAADPLNMGALDIVRNRLGKRIQVYMAPCAEILHLIREIYGFKTSVAAAERDLNQVPDIQNLEQFFSMRSESELDVSDSHIVRAVDHLLRYAFDQRASDIHIEPKREKCIVRLRIDGLLHPVHSFSRRVHTAIISRIKTLSRMDIAEKRLPQDGRIKTEYQSKVVEIRVSTLPVAFGEKAVLRIFDPTLVEKDLPDLGLEGSDLERVEGFLARPHGIFLVTGPTGSGKTTTLYSALRRLATEDRNVSTVEDPIENICAEFNQVGVQTQIGLTFASALRTLLRQDPDIIMVGEIRDSETAKVAIHDTAPTQVIASQGRRSGMRTLMECGIDKVRRGLTTPSEVLQHTFVSLE